MLNLFDSPFFGIILCIFSYAFFASLSKKIHSALWNPLLFSVSLIVLILSVFQIPFANFKKGGDIISMFLAPATCVLAFSIYHQRLVLKQYFIPVLFGCFAGSVSGMASSYFLCKAFGLEEIICRSMIPRSVTTPIAMEVSESLSGIVPITVAGVIITGIVGCVLSPLFIKLLGIKNPVAAGIAIGSSSHALGTTKAVELGEIQGAMSGVAIGVSGIITVLLTLFL